MRYVTSENNLNRNITSASGQSSGADCTPEKNGFRLEVFDIENVETVFAIWGELETRLDSSRLMCSADWTKTWLEHYRDAVDVKFVIGYQKEQAVAVCLLCESQQRCFGPFSVRTLHLGTAGEPSGESVCVEYNEILCEPEWRDIFLAELQTMILTEKSWDQFQLDGIVSPEDDEQVLDNLAALSFIDQKQLGKLPKVSAINVRERESRYFDLKNCREQGVEILSLLGKSTRSNLKRRIKKLGEVEVEWAETAEQAADIFAELVALHQARWEKEGQPGAFASSRFSGFQKELIAKLHPLKRVVLCRIKAGSETIGCLYLLVDNNRLLDYVSGLAAFDQFPSSGLISHYLCMNEAMSRGYDAYDFLVGEKRHKENLGKSANQLQWIVCERRRVVYRLRNGLQFVKRVVKPFLKLRKK